MANVQNADLKTIKSDSLKDLRNEINTIKRANKLDKILHGQGEKKSSTNVKDSVPHRVFSSIIKNKDVVKVMTHHVKFVEKFNILQKKNEKLTQDLFEEKQRCEKYHNKFQCLKGNHEVFQRIRDDYLNKKTNELSVKESVKVDEQESQTENINCPDNIFARYENYDYGSSYTSDSSEAYIPTEPGYTAVKIKEFNAIKKTIKTLKQYIVSQPLSTFVISESREAKFRKDISTLFEENRSLKQLVIDKQIELDKTRREMNDCEIKKECSMLMRIIAKLKLQMDKLENPEAETDETLTAKTTKKEKNIIDHITEKYSSKYTKKNMQQMNKSNMSSPFLTPRTHVESDVETDSVDSFGSTFRSCNEYEDDEFSEIDI